MSLKGALSYEVEVGSDPSGNITRINNALEGLEKKLENAKTELANVIHQLEVARVEVEKPFLQEAELAEKQERLAELNALLDMDEKGDSGVVLDDSEKADAIGEDERETPENVETMEPQIIPIENARHNAEVENGNPKGFVLCAKLPDKPQERPSLKDKLEAFKAKVVAEPGGRELQKNIGKEVI